jgi:hypothetical protein
LSEQYGEHTATEHSRKRSVETGALRRRKRISTQPGTVEHSAWATAEAHAQPGEICTRNASA